MRLKEALGRTSAAVGLRRVDGPPCLLEHGLVPAPPRQEAPALQGHPLANPLRLDRLDG